MFANLTYIYRNMRDLITDHKCQCVHENTEVALLFKGNHLPAEKQIASTYRNLKVKLGPLTRRSTTSVYHFDAQNLITATIEFVTFFLSLLAESVRIFWKSSLCDVTQGTEMLVKDTHFLKSKWKFQPRISFSRKLRWLSTKVHRTLQVYTCYFRKLILYTAGFQMEWQWTEDDKWCRDLFVRCGCW